MQDLPEVFLARCVERHIVVVHSHLVWLSSLGVPHEVVVTILLTATHDGNNQVLSSEIYGFSRTQIRVVIHQQLDCFESPPLT